ncbi:hypothetical protein CXB51_014136 [Gossypium anomalum]|uniref:DUF4283 domain-containing protein n=1 Tax=Gossypium anomalum TaxID=47600 RepID=A0A8J5Z9Q8_9ROSI|nr:hypothetical protein CXB51_014136 [Gossypium anomalum]
MEGDVLTEVVEGVPSITFSNRVQEYIECRMAKTIIVKMLGGKIGLNVLVNKITSLWSPKCPIQLMDLENDFFLVRFQDENDYNKALVGGAWVVWIRLPGLPERYYSNYLFRLAVCVDLRKLLVSKSGCMLGVKTTSPVGELDCARLWIDKEDAVVSRR